jgi:cell division protein FtsI/penicillin-binding protein 2
MKIVTVATARSSGKVGINTMIPINGPNYKDDRVETIRDDEPFNSLSVRDILVHSSNIGAYKLASTVGMKDFVESLRSFHFGSKTGVESNNEKPGRLQKDWTYDGLARTSFGYAITVTPAQMCAALGVMLNDGYYQAPYLIEEVMDHQNNVLSTHSPGNLSRVISASAARATREALVDVVERGTGSKAQSKLYSMAGKTGTAKKLVNKSYNSGQYVVSFLGYAPVENPKLLGVVILDAPQGHSDSLYGGKLAAPIFRRIMDSALMYYEVPGEKVTHTSEKQTSLKR